MYFFVIDVCRNNGTELDPTTETSDQTVSADVVTTAESIYCGFRRDAVGCDT